MHFSEDFLMDPAFSLSTFYLEQHKTMEKGNVIVFHMRSSKTVVADLILHSYTHKTVEEYFQPFVDRIDKLYIWVHQLPESSTITSSIK